MSRSKGVYLIFTVLLVSLVAVGIMRSQTPLTGRVNATPDGNPVVGQIVQFNDVSLGNPLSRQWDFGDGQTSNDKNPAHVFGGPGVFRVTLTVTGAGGASSQIVQQVVVSSIDTLQLNN